MIQLNVFDIDSELKFGKFKGYKLIDALYKDPCYLDWCLVNLPGFLVFPETIKRLMEVVSGIHLSDKADYMNQMNLSFYQKQKGFQDFIESKKEKEDKVISPVTQEELSFLTESSIDKLIQLNESKLKERMENELWRERYENEILDDYIQIRNRLIPFIETAEKYGHCNPVELRETFKRMLRFSPEEEDQLLAKQTRLIDSDDEDDFDIPF